MFTREPYCKHVLDYCQDHSSEKPVSKSTPDDIHGFHQHILDTVHDPTFGLQQGPPELSRPFTEEELRESILN